MPRHRELLAPGRDHGEARNADAVIMQDLLREGLVAGEHQSARIAAGVRHLDELEIAHDVLVEHRLAAELVE